MEDSSSISSFVVEIGDSYPYPYPSHVFAPNFVTVKLSSRELYGVWKTQMLCLLVSHGMLGFINGRFLSPGGGNKKIGDMEAWERSDALVKGWVLGSLSEQTLRYVVRLLTSKTRDFSAKDLWDQLQTIYAPALLRHETDNKEEGIERDAEQVIEPYPIPEEAKSEETESTIQGNRLEASERVEVGQRLYTATLRGRWEDVEIILKTEGIAVTDKITINGNTALHIAVGTTKNTEFLERMLEMSPDSLLLDIRNSDGSTLLHVAAIVGNTDAAKILVQRNEYLLFSEDNEGHMPIARALSNMHSDTYFYLLEPTVTNIHLRTYINMGGMLSATSGNELLVNVISSKDFRSAYFLHQSYHSLHSEAVLMAIAQNFPCPPNLIERISYFLLDVIEIFRERVESSFEIALNYMCYRCVLSCGSWMKPILNLFFIPLKMNILVFPVMLSLLVWQFVKQKFRVKDFPMRLLEDVLISIKEDSDSSSHHHYYTNPVFEATKQNKYEVVEEIVSAFPNAIWSVNEDGHNIIQYSVINGSEMVYNLVYQMSEHKNIYRTIKDSSEHNLLHLAARLTPDKKLNLISCAALQMQREIQWFKEVEGFVCPLNIIQKNFFEETPEMVFSREHKDLVTEGEKWMKATAESYTITAALITIIAFAAAITVPGGTSATGIPIYINEIAFTIFAISDAISLFTSVTSLLMFLSILTARFAEQDFFFKLPTKLIIGLTMLFISTTAMIIAFGATLSLVFGQRKSWILIPIAVLTCLPITSFVTLQVPLIVDLISATYGRSIFGKKRNRPFY